LYISNKQKTLGSYSPKGFDWLQREDSNLRSSGYEVAELNDVRWWGMRLRVVNAGSVRITGIIRFVGGGDFEVYVVRWGGHQRLININFMLEFKNFNLPFLLFPVSEPYMLKKKKSQENGLKQQMEFIHKLMNFG